MHTINDNALRCILGRRSIRKYTADPVSDKDLRTLLEAAMAAPSACGKDPWRFIIVKDSARRSSIADALPNGGMLSGAPIGIVVCGDRNAAHDAQLGYLLQDCSAAIENLLLAATALQLGACWLGVYPREERMARIKEVCAIPDSVMPVVCIALGHPDERKPARTRFAEQYVWNEQMSD